MNQNRNPEELGQYLDTLFESMDSLAHDIMADPEVEVALQLAHTPPPQLNQAMRARIRSNMQAAQQRSQHAVRILPFPKEECLRWTAAFMIFIMILTSIHLPTPTFI